MTVNTGDINKLLKPGLDSIWGEYQEKPQLYPEYMNVKSTKDAFVETVEVNGFGYADQKAESNPIAFEDFKQQNDHRSYVATFAKGFSISMEAIQDSRYMNLGERGTRALSKSLRSTKELNNANILNRGFNSSYTYGDGVELFSVSHPTSDGNKANTFSAVKTFSEASIEDYLILMDNFTDDKGLPIDVSTKCLVVPTSLRYDAQRIVNSQLQPGTANNDLNAIYALGSIPKIVVNRYLDSTTAYFMVTDVEDGLCFYERMAPTFDRYNEEDTLNLKYYAIERYVATVDDWRGAVGEAGA